MQALHCKDKSSSIPNNEFKPVGTPRPEDPDGPIKGIKREIRSDEANQTVHAFAKIDRLCRKVNSEPARWNDHWEPLTARRIPASSSLGNPFGTVISTSTRRSTHAWPTPCDKAGRLRDALAGAITSTNAGVASFGACRLDPFRYEGGSHAEFVCNITDLCPSAHFFALQGS